jgi:hypothetical protein
MTSDPSQTDESRPSIPSTPGKHRDSAADHGASRGQQGSKRFTFPSWPDDQERDLCTYALVKAPERTPIAGRIGLAVAKWRVVEQRNQRVLICNRLHDGACEWPWDVQAG